MCMYLQYYLFVCLYFQLYFENVYGGLIVLLIVLSAINYINLVVQLLLKSSDGIKKKLQTLCKVFTVGFAVIRTLLCFFSIIW